MASLLVYSKSKMNKIISKYCLFLPGQALRGEYTLKYIHEFEKTQREDKILLKKRQLKKFLDLFQYTFNNSPFYHNLYISNGISPDKICTEKDILKIPFLTKDDLRYHQNNMLTPRARTERISSKTTGGSTGQAVTVLKSMRARAYQDAAMWRCLRWHGIDIGDRQARFWGVPFSKKGKTKEKIIDFLMNRIRLSGFMYNEEEFHFFWKKIITFKPTYFYGYVSLIKDFSVYCIEHNLDTSQLKLKAIVTTSEPLYNNVKKLLSETFHCPVINDYGSGETGPISYSCPEGGQHLMSDNLYIEIIKENGTPAKPGEKGEVVVTELNNYAMPLIRYNIKDIVEQGGNDCSCGITLPLINSIAGRDRDVLISPSGVKVHGAYINYIAQQCIKNGYGLKQYQVTQTTPNNIIVKIIPDHGYSKKTNEYITNKLQEALGDEINIKVKIVTKIEREPSGKLRVVKYEVEE